MATRYIATWSDDGVKEYKKTIVDHSDGGLDPSVDGDRTVMTVSDSTEGMMIVDGASLSSSSTIRLDDLARIDSSRLIDPAHINWDVNDIAPEGFNDFKIKIFKKIKDKWPKEFPPIETNTPIWHLMDMMADAVAEVRLTPIHNIPDSVIQKAVEKKVNDLLGNQVDQLIKRKVKQFVDKREKNEQLLKDAMFDELKDV